MLILGIESSCDETSVALVRDGREVLANSIISQMDIHGDFGGVVPELACRRHLEVINPLLEKTLKDNGLSWKDLDAIAVTSGPGLVGAVLIGVAVAKALAYLLNIPLIGVNHLEGHIYGNYLEEGRIEFPSMALLVSGGHTSLILVRDHGIYEIIGETLDDAAGEAYDKVARMLNLGYPGGPIIDRMARDGDPNKIFFPRAMMENRSNFDFSFSGLKTAVVYYLKTPEGQNADKADVCAGFQSAVVDVLVTKTMRAVKKYGVKNILLAGGVARNSSLRENMARSARKAGVNLSVPSLILCTDNAGMIASAGYFNYIRGKVSDLYLDALPNMALA